MALLAKGRGAWNADGCAGGDRQYVGDAGHDCPLQKFDRGSNIAGGDAVRHGFRRGDRMAGCRTGR